MEIYVKKIISIFSLLFLVSHMIF